MVKIAKVWVIMSLYSTILVYGCNSRYKSTSALKSETQDGGFFL